MADGNCCDMDGCVAVFTAIDPQVCAIATFSGINKDTVYTRYGERWEAASARRTRRP
jgi:hypothetical protein